MGGTGRTRVQFEREWLSQCARLDTRADLLGAHAMLLGDPGMVNTRIADYCSVSPDEIREAARRYLGADRFSVAVLGPGDPVPEASP